MLHTHEVEGSSPPVSTILEKSELIPNWECVRIFCLYQRHYILMLKPRGSNHPLGFFYCHRSILNLTVRFIVLLKLYNEYTVKGNLPVHWYLWKGGKRNELAMCAHMRDCFVDYRTTVTVLAVKRHWLFGITFRHILLNCRQWSGKWIVTTMCNHIGRGYWSS